MNTRDRLLAGLPVNDRRLGLAGISTAVLEGGAGPPVVLLHGPGEFSAVWGRAIPELATGHRVIVPDLPGHGASGLPDGRLDVERVLNWLSELIDQTCDRPPTIAGHLLGGAIALRFAANHPDRVRSLVLVDSYGSHCRWRPTSSGRPSNHETGSSRSASSTSTACANSSGISGMPLAPRRSSGRNPRPPRQPCEA